MKFWAKATSQKAELYIYDAIGADYFGDGITAKSVSDALAEFKPNADLDVYMNSPGGSVFEGIAIYNQLLRWGGKKTVHIDGIAASIASVISMAGDEIKIADSGVFMIHSAWGMTAGNAAAMRKYAESLDVVDAIILDTYVKRTKGSKDQIAAWMKAETWMNADEALSRGFATNKTGEKAIKAEFPMLAKFNNTPPGLLKQATSIDTRMAHMSMRLQKLNLGASPKTPA
jgi:ATP-dependent Clp protease protease subunit